MESLENIKQLKKLVSSAQKEGLKELKLSVKFLEDLNDEVFKLLIAIEEEYQNEKIKKETNTSNETLTLKGGTW